MTDSIVSPAYAEYEFMDKAMNRINELIELCGQLTTERNQIQQKVQVLSEALTELVDGIEDGGGTDGNGDTFDLTKAIAALASP